MPYSFICVKQHTAGQGSRSVKSRPAKSAQRVCVLYAIAPFRKVTAPPKSPPGAQAALTTASHAPCQGDWLFAKPFLCVCSLHLPCFWSSCLQQQARRETDAGARPHTIKRQPTWPGTAATRKAVANRKMALAIDMYQCTNWRRK